MAKPKDNVSSLLAAIQRTPAAVKIESALPNIPGDEPAPARTGKQAQFWLHEEDRRLIRELSSWLASQGVRPTDSLVVRAALRIAQGGEALLAAYHEAAARDGRLKRSK
jgi:hypothetical protein